MFRYPVEKNTIRFYKYKFLGKEDDPVVIEAFNRKEARIMLRDFILMNPMFQNIPIIDESLSLPIFGETTRVINDLEHIWVGNGWIPMWEFEKLNID
jgi:hypothetical protein